MTKVRVSTTVDETLLARARALAPDATDASMVQRALRALVDQHRRGEIDEAYAAAFASHPPDESDAWGDLASFADAASRS